MDSTSQDLINDLPNTLLCHILSFLTTKEAASTSLLSRRWRYLLAFVPNIELDDSIFLHPDKRVKNPLHEEGFLGLVYTINNKRMKLSTSFPDFVERILDLQGKSPLHKFFLKIVDGHDPVDPDNVDPWIQKVLVRGVSYLHLVVDLAEWRSLLPAKIFLSETLVKLILQIRDGPEIDVKDVHLPKLKTLYLESVLFNKENVGFSKLLSGCHVLEELVLDHIWSCVWKSCSVSVPTLKTLKFCCENMDSCEAHYENPNDVSFDTPNLVYLEYAEVIAKTYPKVNFDSLVEAKLDLWMPHDEIQDVRSRDNDENYMVSNATNFLVGIQNVRTLCLSADTLEVLAYCCKPIPIFNNLTHLTIKTSPEVGWKSLPHLLKSCPKIETLVFHGLLHRETETLSNEDFVTCISSSSVKVVKIFISTDDDKTKIQIELVKQFLETMQHLEQLVVYYDSSFDRDVKVSTQLQMLTKVASPKCKVQLISRNQSD